MSAYTHTDFAHTSSRVFVHVLFLSPSSSLSRPHALPLCLSSPPSSLSAHSFSFSFSACTYTYVYIYIFVYAYIHTHTHTHRHRRIHNIHAHTRTHKHVLSFSHTRTLTYKDKHAQTQAHTNTCIHLFLPTSIILGMYYDTRITGSSVWRDHRKIYAHLFSVSPIIPLHVLSLFSNT